MGNYIDSAALIAAGMEAEARARTDLDRSGTIDEINLGKFIDQAESEMNQWIAKAGESVPLSAPLDPIIVPIAIDITRYRWWVGATPPEQVTERYRMAIKTLRDVGAGLIKLTINGAADAATECPIEVRARAEVFTDDALAGF